MLYINYYIGKTHVLIQYYYRSQGVSGQSDLIKVEYYYQPFNYFETSGPKRIQSAVGSS